MNKKRVIWWLIGITFAVSFISVNIISITGCHFYYTNAQIIEAYNLSGIIVDDYKLISTGEINDEISLFVCNKTAYNERDSTCKWKLLKEGVEYNDIIANTSLKMYNGGKNLDVKYEEFNCFGHKIKWGDEHLGWLKKYLD